MLCLVRAVAPPCSALTFLIVAAAAYAWGTKFSDVLRKLSLRCHCTTPLPLHFHHINAPFSSQCFPCSHHPLTRLSYSQQPFTASVISHISHNLLSLHISQLLFFCQLVFSSPIHLPVHALIISALLPLHLTFTLCPHLFPTISHYLLFPLPTVPIKA